MSSTALGHHTDELVAPGCTAQPQVPLPRAGRAPHVPTEQEIDCQDTAGRLVRLHVVVGDRGRVGLRIAGQSAVWWLTGGGEALAAAIRTAREDSASRPAVDCQNDAGHPGTVRLGLAPGGTLGLRVPRWRVALWVADAQALGWAARRAHNEAQRRARTDHADHTSPPKDLGGPRSAQHRRRGCR